MKGDFTVAWTQASAVQLAEGAEYTALARAKFGAAHGGAEFVPIMSSLIVLWFSTTLVTH